MIIITAIAAVAANGVIAREGEIPWDLPEDKAHYRDTIAGEPVIMGRRTYRGTPKTDALNVVLTRDPPDEVPENVVFAESVQDALAILEERDIDHAYNVGGGAIYKAFLPHTERLLISEVDGHYEGDTFFPYIEEDEWEEISREPYEGFDVVTYDRRGIRIPVEEA